MLKVYEILKQYLRMMKFTKLLICIIFFTLFALNLKNLFFVVKIADQNMTVIFQDKV